jgi:sterol desaturase/sphingolipid hydroxylase (fatty acid hydroxylase superfamily)
VETLWAVFLHFLERLSGAFLSPGSVLSVTSLGSAFAVAVAYVAFRRYRRGRRIRLRVLARALFPRRFARHPSMLVDLGYVFFSLFVFGAMFGWALLSYQVLSNGVTGLLTSAFGPVTPTALPEPATRALVTLVLFLAYELGYWFHHYLCHRVPFLWEFHKVHHTANVLTPLTVFRVHPIDTWLFVNILAVAVGVANGLANYALGITAYQYALSNANLILVVFIHVYVHLQHSHLWIAFRGLAGRVLLSPAHHQIHHSNDPVHFNKNLGSCLAVWDWLFGTLHIPAKEPERLTFGVAPGGRDEHTITEAYIAPVYRAAAHVAALGRGAHDAPTPLAAGAPAPAGNDA